MDWPKEEGKDPLKTVMLPATTGFIRGYGLLMDGKKFCVTGARGWARMKRPMLLSEYD
jgi:hypothetical protein